MYPLLVVDRFQSRNCKKIIKNWIETRISVLASGLCLFDIDAHSTPNKNIVMDTGGREAFVVGRSKVNLKKISFLPV